MIAKSQLSKINDYLWEIPETFRADMRVPARVYASEKMLDEILKDKSLEQIINVAALPGIQKYALAMPDAHEGYGFPIGGVAAFSLAEGVISPGGIGYDINCGVRLLLSELFFKDVGPQLVKLNQEIYRQVPSGVGRGGSIILKGGDFDKVLESGAKRAVEMGYGAEKDLANIESGGHLKEADARAVSERAKKRGRDQLGTIGAGNHFVEIDRVDKVLDKETADKFGINKDQIMVLIHTGSRGLGHQIATDYIRMMLNHLDDYGFKIPDRELACAPFLSKHGQDYFKAMSAGANFAWANRQVITAEVRQAWKKIFNSDNLRIIYDVAHNIAKVEKYDVANIEGDTSTCRLPKGNVICNQEGDIPGYLKEGGQTFGRQEEMIVHRKGATRAFPGQPVIIPGSMGTASYLLLGQEKSLKVSFGSTCHGAGRRLSRMGAKKQIRGDELKKELERRGIALNVGSMSGLAEEAPAAYKDVDEVVGVIHEAGIAKKVARLAPVGVIKG